MVVIHVGIAFWVLRVTKVFALVGAMSILPAKRWSEKVMVIKPQLHVRLGAGVIYQRISPKSDTLYCPRPLSISNCCFSRFRLHKDMD